MWVYLCALLFAIGTWYFVKHLSQNQEFQKKPIGEQQKIKKKILWGMYGGLAIGCLLAWLMQNGFTSWARYLPIVVYLLIWMGGGYLLWFAYIFGVRRNLEKIITSDGRPFKQPQKYLNKFAITNLVSGCALLLIAIAIPVMKIDFQKWGGLIILVLAIRKFAVSRFEKSDSGSEN